jgi:hypothetical protein
MVLGTNFVYFIFLSHNLEVPHFATPSIFYSQAKFRS